MFGDVVMGVPHSKFEHQLERLKVRTETQGPCDIPAEAQV